MIDRDKPQLFIDMECPRCGHTCGNGGHGGEVLCSACGWTRKIEIHPDDIKAVEGVIQQYKERNKEPTP